MPTERWIVNEDGDFEKGERYLKHTKQSEIADLLNEGIDAQSRLAAAEAALSEARAALTARCPHHDARSKTDEQGKLHHFAADNEFGYTHWFPCRFTDAELAALSRPATETTP